MVKKDIPGICHKQKWGQRFHLLQQWNHTPPTTNSIKPHITASLRLVVRMDRIQETHPLKQGLKQQVKEWQTSGLELISIMLF